MSSLMEKWLQNSIGLKISLNPATLGEDCFDGTLYAKILSRYGVCHQNYIRNIVKTKNYCSAFNNLRKLGVWFKLLDIPYTEDLLRNIAGKNGESALKILYELFLRLEGRENMKIYVEEKLQERSAKKADVNKLQSKDNFENISEKIYSGTVKFSLGKAIKECEKRRLMVEGMIKKKGEQIPKINLVSEPNIPDVFKQISIFESEMAKPEKKEVMLEVEKWKPNTLVSFTKIKQRLKEDENCSRYLGFKNVLDEAKKSALKRCEQINRERLAKKFYLLAEKEKEGASVIKGLRRFEAAERVESIKSIQETIPKETPKQEVDKDQMERDRKKALHDRLYARKMAAKKKLLPSACEKIASDIVDLYFLNREFKGMKPMDKLFKYMFRKGLTLIETPEHNELPESSTGVESEDTEREAESEYQDYMLFTGAWDPENLLGTPKKHRSQNVLGHIVHRILSDKTEPKIPVEHLVQFPEFEIRILLKPRLCPELSRQLTEKLNPDIIVLNGEQAVEYALSAYKLFYFGSEDNGEKSQEPGENQNDVLPEVKPLVKQSVRLSSKKSMAEPKFREFGVQFPSKTELDSQDQWQKPPGIILLAELVFHFLKMKKEIPYILKCFIIMDIIKNLGGLKGWLICNLNSSPIGIVLFEYVYSGCEPTFLEANVALEAEWNELKKRLTTIRETLSTLENCYLKTVTKNNLENDSEYVNDPNILCNKDLKVSGDAHETEGLSNIEKALKAIGKLCDLMVFSHDEELTKILSRNNEKSEILLEKSNILPKPYPDVPAKPFQSIFTHVIRLSDKFSRMEYEWNNKEDIMEQDLEEEFTENKDETIEEECCLNISELSLSIESVVTDKIDEFYNEKGIFLKFPYSKYTIHRMNILLSAISNSKEIKNSDCFPDFVKLLTERYIENALARCEGQLDLVDDNNSAQSSGDRKNNAQLLREFLEEGYGEEATTEEITEKKLDLYPGHPFWSYTTPSIPQEYSKPLKTIWDKAENQYLYNLSTTFKFLKEMDYKFIRFSNDVSSKCDECLGFTDKREDIANCFLKTLNNIKMKFRSTVSAKEELYRCIFKLQCKLWQLADIKKQNSRKEIHRIRNKPTKMLCKYARYFVHLLQTELNRFIYTMQLITDFHNIVLLDSLSKERLKIIFIPTFKCYIDFEDNSDIDKYNKSNSAEEIKIQEESFLNKSVECFKFDKKTKLCIADGSCLMKFLVRLKEILRYQIKCVQSLCKNIHKDVGPVALFRQDHKNYGELGRVMMEWSAALNEEACRTKLRIGMIHARALEVIKHRKSALEMTMDCFGKDVARQYRIEIYGIDKFCDALKTAVEDGVKVEVGNYQFYGNPYVKYDCPTPPTTPGKHLAIGYRFNFKHLRNLFNKFSEIAPTGVVKQSLVFILQDMAMTGHDLCHPYIPPVWSYLTPENIAYVVDQCFGKKSVVSWKDFIIFALDLRYPTLREIWHLKNQYKKYDKTGFELITYKIFKRTPLWFQKRNKLNKKMSIQNCLIKKLLFDLFETEGCINYNCFLLAFCKDKNPNVAFLKALTVVDDSVFELLANKSVYSDTFKEFEKSADVMEFWNISSRIPELVEEYDFEDYLLEEESHRPYFEEISSEFASEELNSESPIPQTSLSCESILYESCSESFFRYSKFWKELVPRELVPVEESFVQRSLRKKFFRKKLKIRKMGRKKSLTLKKLDETFRWFLANARTQAKSLGDVDGCEDEGAFDPEVTGFEVKKKKRSMRECLHLKKNRWPEDCRLLQIAKLYAIYSIRQGIRNHKLHVDKLLGLFLFNQNYFAFHPKHSSEIKCIFKKIKKFVYVNTNGFKSRVHEILDSCFIKNILSSYAFFRPIWLSKYSIMLYESTSSKSNVNP